MDGEFLAELAEALASEIPNALPQIEAHLSNETFHDMCSEYQDCNRSLDYWKRLGNQERIKEYQALMNDLLAEVLQFLEEHPE